MPDRDADEAARLLAIADQYFSQAAAARELAAAIDQRRMSLSTRLEPCVRRHLPEVWSSAAAEVSRMKLTRMIARDVWAACAQLLETRTALLNKAEEADTQAFVLRSRAAEIHSTATNDHDLRTPDPLT